MANPVDYGYEEATWFAIKEFMEGNEFATAGWMGNFYSESNIVPYRLQGDFTNGFVNSHTYTNNVNNGTIKRATFMNDGKGYGLAQWTYYTRKAGMYDFWNTDEYRGGEVSIGSFNFNIAWFKRELDKDFPTIKAHMLTVTDVDSASDYVLVNYENPAGIEAAKPVRRAQSRYYYQKYTGKTPGPGPGPGPDPPGPDPPTPTPPKKKFKWIYYIPRRY